MDLEKFKLSISSKYEILKFLVLNDYETLPSNSLYLDLKPIIKDCYQDKDRSCFWCLVRYLTN